MMRFPLFSVVGLLGLAVSAPAQVKIDALLGRHVQVSARAGFGDHEDHGRRVHRHRGPVARGPVVSPRHREPVGHPPVHGHWQTVCEEVWIPGCWREECVPAVYGWISDSCGHRHWGIVRAGYTHRIWVPGRHETRQRRVWVPGC
jgi:hypothetical protein